jgi:hypothetical protein
MVTGTSKVATAEFVTVTVSLVVIASPIEAMAV